MTTITVKNLPPELYEQLKRQALHNHRSINREIITIIQQSVTGRSLIEVAQLLEQAHSVRELSAHYILSDDEIEQAINAGRA